MDDTVLQQLQQQIKNGNFETARDLATQWISRLHKCSKSEILLVRHKMGLSSSQEMKHPQLFALYDIRFTALARQRRLEDAYKDALKMIKLEPSNAKGYLRCSQVLERLNDVDKALSVVKKGTQMCAHTKDKYYSQLQEKERGLSRKRSMTSAAEVADAVAAGTGTTKRHKRKCLDFCNYLPHELLELVFGQFSVEELLRFMLVCKKWKRIVGRLGSVYQKFNFRTVMRPERMSEFLTFVAHCKQNYQPHIQVLSLARIDPSYESSVLNKLLHNKSRLFVDQLCLNFDKTDAATLTTLFENSRRKSLLHSLKHLQLVVSYNGGSEKLLFLCPNLLSLQITFIRGSAENDKQYEITEEIPKFPLKTLRLFAKSSLDISLPFLNICRYLHCLERIYIAGFLVQNFSLFQLPVKELYFEANQPVTVSEFIQNEPNVKNLSSLVFRESNGPKTYLRSTLQCKMQLKSLDLYQTSLDFEGLMNVLDSLECGVLQYLNIGNSSFLGFTNSLVSIENIPGSFDFTRFLSKVANIKTLVMPKCAGFGDYTLRQMRQAILQLRTVDENFWEQVKVLDFSLNEITGVGLVEFFGYKRKTQTLQKSGSMGSKVRKITRSKLDSTDAGSVNIESHFLRLEKLVLNGVQNVGTGTAKLLVNEGFTGEILNDVTLTEWCLFSKNSYKMA